MGLAIFLLIVLILWLSGPKISAWLKAYAMGKMEDRMRRMMGMPTRAEEKKAREAYNRANGFSETGERQKKERRSWKDRFREQSERGRGGDPAADLRMMREYAEDVEFTEIREYSESMVLEQDKMGKQTKINIESQVSDAEYVVVWEKK